MLVRFQLRELAESSRRIRGSPVVGGDRLSVVHDANTDEHAANRNFERGGEELETILRQVPGTVREVSGKYLDPDPFRRVRSRSPVLEAKHIL